MKLWFEWGDQFDDDSYIFLGIGGFWHHKDHDWVGWDLYLYLPFNKRLSMTWVSNWKAYDLKINRRRIRTLVR